MAIDKTNPVGRFGCFKVLPLIYDEALSYYEVICKLRDSLNDVITQANSLVDALGMTDSEIADLEQIVGEGSVDDRIYGAELAAKQYADGLEEKTGTVLFDGTLEYGNTGADMAAGTEWKLNDYKSVIVYDQYAVADGGVICSVTPSTSGYYVVSGIGNVAVFADGFTDVPGVLMRVWMRYDPATNRIIRSQCYRPDDHEDDPTGEAVHATIKKIIGLR